MKTIVRSGTMLAAMLLLIAGMAKADNIHLCPARSGCSANGVIPLAGGATTAYLGGNPNRQELFLAILTPVTGSSGNWNNNRVSMWSVLGNSVAGGASFPTLSSAISQELFGTGLHAGSFNVKQLDLGTLWTTNGQLVKLPASPAGAIVVAFTKDSRGRVTWVTPWSSSLVRTPEPTSLLLLGAGLVGLLGTVGLRRGKA